MVKAEEVELSPSVVAGDGSAEEGIAACHFGGGTNKRRSRVPTSVATVHSGVLSLGRKRARSAEDDDDVVVVLEHDGHAAAAVTEAVAAVAGEAANTRSGARIAVKPEV